METPEHHCEITCVACYLLPAAHEIDRSWERVYRWLDVGNACKYT